MSRSIAADLHKLIVQFENDIHQEVSRHGWNPFGDWGALADLSVEGYQYVLSRRVRSALRMIQHPCGFERGYYAFRSFLKSNKTLQQINQLLEEYTTVPEIRPIDEINGFKLTGSGADLASHALYLLHLGFELPISWWQDHIVPDYPDKLERCLLVDGPVYAAHEISVFDSWKQTCRLMKAYTEAAYSGFEYMMGAAVNLTHKIKPGSVFVYQDLRNSGQLSRHSLRFLQQIYFLTTVRSQHQDKIQVTLGAGPRSWHYETTVLSLDQSFNKWRDHIAMNLDKYTIPELINCYLAVSDPQRFGGGA